MTTFNGVVIIDSLSLNVFADNDLEFAARRPGRTGGECRLILDIRVKLEAKWHIDR